ncbi:FabD/lysophospholipase-like protein [Serendipita vermifera]|nr:FabD/lysophospholipase-like protein [Serendipita vermifera]
MANLHQPTHRVLVLDGGDFRGISQLYIIADLMHRIRQIQRTKCPDSRDHEYAGASELRPCKCFDVIAGTGIGGFNAILLGRLGLTVSQSIEILERLQHEVFDDNGRGVKYLLNLFYFLLRSYWSGILSTLVAIAALSGTYRLDVFSNSGQSGQHRVILGFILLFIHISVALLWNLWNTPSTTLLSSNELEQFARRIVMEATGDPDTMMKTEKPSCHSFVTAKHDTDSSSSVVLSSYRLRNICDIDCTIWQAIRATLAIPEIFEPVRIAGQSYIANPKDNNPVPLVLQESINIVRASQGHNAPSLQMLNGHTVRCIISVGSGHRGAITFKHQHPIKLGFIRRRFMAVTRWARDRACERVTRLLDGDTEIVHQDFSRVWEKETYFRFNVIHGLQGHDMQWTQKDTRKGVASHSRTYNEHALTGESLDKAARLLAKYLESQQDRICS